MKKFGWKPDLPDHRDHVFSVEAPSVLPDSHKIDLPFCYDQKSLGSCTANAVAALIQYRELLADGDAPVPSRLALYYNTRVIEKTVEIDSGASIRNAVKSAVKFGVTRETSWPYLISKFKDKPSPMAQKDALEHRVTLANYARVLSNLNSLKKVLYAGNPIVFGFSVYDSFMSEQMAKDGIMPMPDKSERMVGGHAVLMTGYDDATGCFTVKNSWGNKWGKVGSFFMPYEYATNSNLADDFWTIYNVKPLS